MDESSHITKPFVERIQDRKEEERMTVRKTLFALIALTFVAGVAVATGEAEGSGSGAATAGGSPNEAPMLQELVAAGDLPPLEERLPENPLVIDVEDGIGRYGGDLFLSVTSPRGFGTDLHVMGFESPLAINADTTVGPNVIESWDISSDKRVYTLRLRKGIKWSDGEPLTTDDLMFWWNDEVNNPILTENVFIVEFQEMELEQIDDYTVRATLGRSFPLFERTLSLQWAYQGEWYRPSHFLKDFNPNYVDNDVLLERAEAEGYDTIRDYYYSRAGWSPHPIHADTPTLISFDLVETSADTWIWERNPYYWKVDPEGNQLPYIDRLVVRRVENAETIQAQVISGEVDIEVWTNSLTNFPLYRENENAGDYRTLLWQSDWSAEVQYMPNQNVADDTLRAIFRDARFRQALSLAINRDEINEQLYFGRAVPRQFTLHPSSQYYNPEWAESYAEYDPAAANALLDQMRLTQRDDDGFRLMPDGRRLGFTIQYWPQEPATKTDINELVKEYWAAIGVDATLQSQDRALNSQRAEANEIEMNMWHGGGTTDPAWSSNGSPPLPRSSISWATLWGQWQATGGEEGERPPQSLIDYFTMGDQLVNETNEAERRRIAEELWSTQAEELWTIGTVGLAPYPIIVSRDLRNVPETGTWSGDTRWLRPYRPEQFWLDR